MIIPNPGLLFVITVPRVSDLDRDWQELMFLCDKETELVRDGTHPKVLAFIRTQIESLASQMGFSAAQIQARQFRAERDGQHITRILPE
jgi:hypothetical protein